MSWKQLLEPDIQSFVKANADGDVAALALKKAPDPNWPYKLVLDQIKSRQKAGIKIPGWLGDGVILPPPNILEQASSAATASYKAALVKGDSFADLTGGAGVDAHALGENFKSGTCIDRDENAAELLAHNLSALSQNKIDVQCADAEEFVKTMAPVDLVMIDPQRRSDNKKGLYKFADCSPNIIALLFALKDKTKTVMVKASPMLDIQKGAEELGPVTAIHIIEWNGECKELVFILDLSLTEDFKNTPITAVAIDDNGSALNTTAFTKSEEENTNAETGAPQKYLYEPGPAFQKSGAYNVIAEKYGLKKLHKHTHLYTGEDQVTDFPGRAFEIIDVLPVDAKALSFEKANLAVRNFPSGVDDLRKKLKLKEGGDDYLFACTLEGESKALIHTRKTDNLI